MPRLFCPLHWQKMATRRHTSTMDVFLCGDIIYFRAKKKLLLKTKNCLCFHLKKMLGCEYLSLYHHESRHSEISPKSCFFPKKKTKLAISLCLENASPGSCHLPPRTWRLDRKRSVIGYQVPGCGLRTEGKSKRQNGYTITLFIP